jgi:hypothetical protein
MAATAEKVMAGRGGGDNSVFGICCDQFNVNIIIY